MKISIEDLESGKYDNKIVYICDYRRPDLKKKCTRHVRPIEVKVRENGTRISGLGYGSKKHFTSTARSGIIKVNDNTGRRYGNPVHIFDNKEECISYYNKLITETISDWCKWYENAYNVHSEEVGKLEELLYE